MGSKIRNLRHFSTEFKKEKVKQIDEGKITVSQISRIYEVSVTAVYKWVRQYFKYAVQSEKIIVEKLSEGAKTLQLLKKVAELEQLIGRNRLK